MDINKNKLAIDPQSNTKYCYVKLKKNKYIINMAVAVKNQLTRKSFEKKT